MNNSLSVYSEITNIVFYSCSEKYHAQMKEAQQVVTEKTSSLEAEAYKTKRLQVGAMSTVCILFIVSWFH